MSYRQHYNTTSNNHNNTSNSKCANYSTPSNCRTEYETPYQVVDLISSSSPIQRTPSLSPWAFGTNTSSISSPTPSFTRSPTMPALPTPTLSTSYRDPLRSVHGSPRVTKIDHRPMHPYQQQQHQHHIRSESPSETAIPFNRRRSSSSLQPLYDTTNTNNANVDVNTIYEDPLSTDNHRWRSSSPSPPVSPRRRHSKNSTSIPRRISLTTSPRSNGRLPSLFDRIKAALELPKRPSINTSPLPPIRTNLNQAQLNEQDGLTGHASPTATTLAAAAQTMDPSHIHSNFTYNGFLDATNNLVPFWCPPMVAKPTLFGIPCTVASQKAYSRHSHDVKASFQRLQLEDRGAVENRTIAFSTHLTISRWEPIPFATNSNNTTATAASTTTPIASSSAPASTLANYAEEGTPSSESTSLQQQPQPHQQLYGSQSTGAAPLDQSPLQPQQDNPVHAARLISLANYIRHIISLSSGSSPLHSQSTLIQQRLLLVQRQQQQLRQQQKLQESRPAWATANKLQQDSTSLPSPLSAGPGPMKNNSLSARRHRQTSEYHDHAARRQHHHHQQQQQQQQLQTPAPIDPASVVQEPLPSPTSPILQVGRRSSQPQQQLHNTGNEQPAAVGAGSKLALTLPKVPFPNLTLTLALIYVDRLKEKNPAAKGEPGCSHRLFLVAYIIAAKYRCSVELAALLQEQYRSDASTTSFTDEKGSDQGEVVDKSAIGGVSCNNNSCSSEEEEAKSIDQRICEARSRAEVILSNQAWVQLLSLGSFMRPIKPASSATTNNNATAAVSARTSPSQPMKRSAVSNATGTLELGSGVEAKPLPIQSLPSTTTTTATPLSANERLVDETTITHGAQQTQTVSPPSSNSSSPSIALPPQSPPTSILQVEDLNRMESEFLTFLDYDLAARSQDLDTCWGLLVGNKAI